jgi:predicted MFS family arabinose efflux permease
MPAWTIFKDWIFLVTLLAVFMLQSAYFLPITYISSYALYHGFSPAFSSNALIFINVGPTFGRWLPGIIGDKIGHYNCIILMTPITIVSILGVWLPLGQTKAGLVVLYFFLDLLPEALSL